MKTDMDFVIVHEPVFCGGTNLGLRIDVSKRTGLKMVYDSDEQMLYTTWNGQTCWTPFPTIAHMLPAGQKVEASKPVTALPTPGAKIQAQVSSPQSHVSAGLGFGQTGQVRK